jgi:hypothetical protein
MSIPLANGVALVAANPRAVRRAHRPPHAAEELAEVDDDGVARCRVVVWPRWAVGSGSDLYPS